MYQVLVSDMEKGGSNWVSSVKETLEICGLGDIWRFQTVLNEQWVGCMFKQRIQDIYVQQWRDRMRQKSRGEFYLLINPEYEFSLYLDSVTCRAYRHALTKLRLSSHHLAIESGRWRRPNPIPRAERKCQICDLLEDEYHLIFECRMYSNVRTYLPQNLVRRHNMFKFIQILTDNNLSNCLGRYTHQAFKLRSSIVDN